MSPTEQIDWREAALQADAAMKAASVAWIVDVDIVYSSVIALSLTPRTKELAISAAKLGDRVYVHRRGRPTLTGVSILSGVILEATGLVTEDGKVETYHVIPGVGIGQTLTIPLRLIGNRPGA